MLACLCVQACSPSICLYTYMCLVIIFTIGWLHGYMQTRTYIYVCVCECVRVYAWILLYIYIYITKISQFLLEKLIVAQLLKEFPAFYGMWKFITVLTSLPISWARLIQFTTEIYFFGSYFNIILSSVPRFFKKSIPFRIYYQNIELISRLFFAYCIPCPSYSPWLTRPNNGEVYKYKLWNSYLYNSFQVPVNSTIWDPNIIIFISKCSVYVLVLPLMWVSNFTFMQSVHSCVYMYACIYILCLSVCVHINVSYTWCLGHAVA
jgi:hypothetical protein